MQLLKGEPCDTLQYIKGSAWFMPGQNYSVFTKCLPCTVNMLQDPYQRSYNLFRIFAYSKREIWKIVTEIITWYLPNTKLSISGYRRDNLYNAKRNWSIPLEYASDRCQAQQLSPPYVIQHYKLIRHYPHAVAPSAVWKWKRRNRLYVYIRSRPDWACFSEKQIKSLDRHAIVRVCQCCFAEAHAVSICF